MIYFTLLTLMVLLSLLEICGIGKVPVHKSISIDRIAFVYLVSLLFLVAALRYETGRDWQNYMWYFKNCLSHRYVTGLEPGFVTVNKFFKAVFGNFYVMQFFIMLFCCTSVYRSFYRRSEYPVFTLFLYFVSCFLSTDMAQTRQHIAMAILLCGDSFIQRKRFALWVMVVLLAMQFHITALTAFPLYFTTRKEVPLWMAVLLYVLCIVVILFGLSAVRGSLAFITSLGFVPERIRRIGTAYLNSKIYGQKSESFNFLVNYGFILLMLFFYFTKKGAKNQYFLLNFLIALLFQAMGKNFDQFHRIAGYYFICGGGFCAYNLLIDSGFFFRKVAAARLLVCTLFVLAMAYIFYAKWALGRFAYKNDYAPYQSVLFEEAK